MMPNEPTSGSGEPPDKPEINFPCRWDYTVIGIDESVLRAIVEVTVRGMEYTFEFSHNSKTGKYRSFRLSVVVYTDAERLRVFRALHEHPDVKYVL